MNDLTILREKKPVNNLDQIQEIVNKQAEDEGLWFIAETVSEAYLQKALRELHMVIENCG